MITFPNAKINLGLHITEERTDKYHNLETVLYPVMIKDALEIRELKAQEIDQRPFDEKSFRLQTYGIKIDSPIQNNLVVKAFLLFKQKYNLPSTEIHLYKHIPSGAGLGGGSSDAAFMLKLLNKKFSLKLSDKQLETEASILGADCAFFINNKPTFASGIGNVFSPISLSLKGYGIVIVKPNIFISTKETFAHIHPQSNRQPLKEIITLPIKEWKNKLVNDFESYIFPQYREIAEIKKALYNKGAVYASLSGSGSSVYGIFPPNDNRHQLSDFNTNKKSFFYEGIL